MSVTGAVERVGSGSDVGSRPSPGSPRRSFRFGRRALVITGALAVLALAAPVLVVQVVGSSKVFTPDEVPNRSVALVLGAGLQAGGKPSVFLTRRLDMARELYERGKVDVILVSGDNALEEHDEPTAMFNWLVEAGIPADRVVRDHAGFDTHDSCKRAHDVFGVEDAIVVTQDYHLPRALFSCSAAGIDAVGVGVSSTNVARSTGTKYRVREAAASVKASWDALTGRPPVYGGTETSITDLLSARKGSP